MKAKTALSIAVAGALSWSYGAMANSDRSHMGMQQEFEVITPFSPNETGVAEWPGERSTTYSNMHASAEVERSIETPMASNEGAARRPFTSERIRTSRSDTTRFQATRSDASRLDRAHVSSSMPNPETPWAVPEAGFYSYDEEMRAREQHVAEVEQAHLAAAEWNARLASGSASEVTEPVGMTSGYGLHGTTSTVDFHDRASLSAGPSTGSSGEPGTPAEVERPSDMRSESEYGIPATGPNTVGVLEVPVQVTEHTVWSVEPLAPNADLTRGDTVYLPPDSSQAIVIPGGEPGVPERDRSAGLSESESREPGESSL